MEATGTKQRGPTEQDFSSQDEPHPFVEPQTLPSAPRVEDVCKDKFRQKRNLVLCFDGTSNEFKGDGTDTNILKIYGMLDKNVPEQYHYYQPGIGTYVTFDSAARTDKLAALRAKGTRMIDLMFGTSVSEHVLGGYKFLMRYWAPEDDIYIFGFSRGAYTARFLAEMLDHIGLLPHGNEELVGFAWKIFEAWQRREWTLPKETNAFWKKVFEGPMPTPKGDTAGHAATEEKNSVVEGTTVGEDERMESPEYYSFLEYLTLKPRRDKKRLDAADVMKTRMDGFKQMFSRHVRPLRFLGLFDTVSSVPHFDVSWMTRGGRFAFAPRSSADEIWHAVSVDERRVCFRANLMYQSPPRRRTDDDDDAHDNPNQKVREVWFAGNHGDVGGGWAPPETGAPMASYLPLVWMVRAAKNAGVKFSEEGLEFEDIKFEPTDVDPVENVQTSCIVSAPKEEPRQDYYAVESGVVLDDLHDCLAWGKGMKWNSYMWRFLQIFPIKVMEYIDNGWKPTVLRRRPHRTIPKDKTTRIHASVFDRMQRDKTYKPSNLPGCTDMRACKWWQHGPLRPQYETGFCFDHWVPALEEYSGTDYISLVYKMDEEVVKTSED